MIEKSTGNKINSYVEKLELVREALDEYGIDYNDLEGTRDRVFEYLSTDIEFDDSEEKEIFTEIEKELGKKLTECLKLEEHLLKDRNSILIFIESLLSNNYFFEDGIIGHVISAERILDLILKNGKK